MLIQPNDSHALAFKASLQDYIATQRGAASNRDLSALYAASVTAFAAANFWAQNLSAVPFRAHDPSNKPLPPTSTHPLARLLRPANFAPVIKGIVYADLFWGRNLLEKERLVTGQTARLKWINPNFYTVQYAFGRGITGFRLYPTPKGTQESAFLQTKDAAYFNGFSFDDDTDGVSAAEAAFLQAATEPEIALTVLSTFRNLAIPAAIAQPAEDPKGGVVKNYEKDADVLTSFLRRAIRGAKNAGKVLVTATRWQWIQLTPTYKDMEMGTLREQIREDTAAAFDVNVEFFITGQTNYAELEGKIQLWEQRRLAPRANWYAQQLTDTVCNEFPGYTIQPDLSNILKEDEEQKLAIINSKLDSITLTLYDAQRQMGAEQPDENLRGLYVVQGVPVPATELQNYWRSSGSFGAMPFSPPASALPTPVLPDAAASVDTGHPEACVMLSFPNQPDLMALQSRVKAYCNGVQAEWNTPDDYHVTLAYMPSVDPAQADALKAAFEEIDIPAMALRIGSLKTFDDVGQYALHFRIRRNADLLDLQETVYDLLTEQGVPISAYSRPEQYAPHITMGYASSKPPTATFKSSLTVEPTALRLFVGDDMIYERLLGTETATDSSALAKSETFVPDEQWLEIKKWQHMSARKGRGYAFAVAHLPGIVADYVKLSLEDAEADLVEVFDSARAYLKAYKGYAETRATFIAEMERLIGGAARDESNRSGFAGQMRAALRRYGLLAFRDGLTDGGDTSESLDEDALTIFRAWQAEQSDYISNLGAEIFKSSRGLSEVIVPMRSHMWANKSLDDIYYAGLRIAAPTKMATWQRNPLKDSCEDCVGRDNQSLTVDEWGQLGFPRDRRLACGGWECGCDLFDESGKRIGAR